jgi:alpha-L-fucosidase
MKREYLFIIILLILPLISFSQEKEEDYIWPNDPEVLKNLSNWQDLKFGLLMHWGPYSQWGVVESWSICNEEWITRSMDNYEAYKQAYTQLPATFKPEKFNPDEWARIAKDAGMKYVVFTTKHHDGFCMFDTRQTSYRITGKVCPFHSDKKSNVTLGIFNAFRNEGLLAGAYFSKPDWKC